MVFPGKNDRATKTSTLGNFRSPDTLDHILLWDPKCSQVFPRIFSPHLGQVISTFPFPTGTRQIVLHFLQVK